jgi:hypothetical protein
MGSSNFSNPYKSDAHRTGQRSGVTTKGGPPNYKRSQIAHQIPKYRKYTKKLSF